MAAKPTLSIAANGAGRLLLGGAFAWAAAAKIHDPATFASDITHYRLLPHVATLALSLYLPWLELLCAAAVLTRRCERGALAILLVLCVIFSAALTSAWLRGLDISCGCFGGGGASTPLVISLLRSLGLGVIALLLLRSASIQSTSDLEDVLPK